MKGLLVCAAAAGLGCGGSLLEDLEGTAAACPDVGNGGLAVGVNAYYLQEEAALALRAGGGASPVVEEVFAKASALGATVVRTWAFNDDPARAGASAIQTAPGVYDEVSLRGLDLVLDRAAAHGLKLILPLGNRWDDYGGARQYLAWAGLADPAEGDQRFFSDPGVRRHYRDHVAAMLARYGRHPAVLAWELLNEPRPTAETGPAFRAWIDELASHVKALAPGHLVGTGEEGFDLGFEGYSGRYWSAVARYPFEGSGRFRENLASPGVDLASIHLFPELWSVPPEEIARAGAVWIRDHAALARAGGKPLVLGELGLRNAGALTLAERRAIYRGWLRCARASGVVAALPWLFAYDARPDEWDEFTFYFKDGTRPEDPVNRYADLLLEAARGGR